MAASYNPNINFQAIPSKHTAKGNFPSDVTGKSPSLNSPVGYATLPTLIGEGILLAVSGERVLCQNIGSVDQNSLKIAGTMNNSFVLERLHYSEAQKEVRFFVKPDFSHHAVDLQTLGYLSNLTDLLELVELQVGSVTVSAQMYDSPVRYVTIELSNNYTVWKIFYGVTMRQAADIVLESARDIAIDQAWRNERRLLLSGRRGTYFWTSEERLSLAQNNMVPGYEGQYTLDPVEYPNIAFDGNNIKIIRSDPNTRR